MTTRRILVTGAAGAGTTTLGRALAGALACPHQETDDYFFRPTDPPYIFERPVPERLALMESVFLARPDWVLSGSITGWGEAIEPELDLVVFIYTSPGLRLQRLRSRELRRYGAEAIAPGGWRHTETEGFLEWAASYEEGDRQGRSLARHEEWLGQLGCMVHRADGSRRVDDIVGEVLMLLERRDCQPAGLASGGAHG